jgi:hypothetical protein
MTNQPTQHLNIEVINRKYKNGKAVSPQGSSENQNSSENEHNVHFQVDE